MMKNFLAAAIVMAGILNAPAKVEVASLNTVLADLTRQIGGDRVEVVEIVKPGVDPHIFEPSPGDIKKLSQAQVVLASGLGFESYLPKLQQSVGSGPQFVVAGDAMKPLFMTEDEDAHDHDHGHSHAHGAGGKVVDPHWWHSIANAKIAAREIQKKLSAVDPDGAAEYDKNTKALLAKLDALSKWAKLEIAKLPKDRRVLVTSHDALGYFAKDYGFEVLPVQGISTSDQPSSRKVRELIDTVKARGVKAIFAENIENPKVLTEITRETGAKVGGALYADGLGAGEAATYEAMMKHNVTTIVGALQ
jgi:zinc/manganese transport system substrate-binding protein